MTSLDPRALRNAFGTFMTGVTVVTSYHKDGQPVGFTANSFASVSLDPPLVSVCLAKSSSNFDTFLAASGFAVNVLAENQIEVSNTFARPAEDRFATVAWRDGPHGFPVLDDVSSWFDCSMHKTVDAGDHVILIGQVEAFATTSAPGLGYARGAYVTPTSTADALERTPNLTVSTLIEKDGHVLLLEDGKGGLTLPEAMVTDASVSLTLETLIASTGLHAQPGFVYSVFEDTDRKRHHISFLCQAVEGMPTDGTFVPLTASGLARVSDPAIRTLLDRFATESAVGTFGIYYGDDKRGQVRTIA